MEFELFDIYLNFEVDSIINYSFWSFSGLIYCSSGFYHDPSAGWYYSSRDGFYYKFEDGNYVLLESDQVVVSLSFLFFFPCSQSRVYTGVC